MASPHHWPEADCIEALRLKESGMTWRQVGEVLGKSKSAAEAACRRYQGHKKAHVYYSADDPPIGIEQSERCDTKRTINASASLRRAIQALMERMPARVVAEVLCQPPAPIPGTEVIFKTASMERLAA